MTLETGQVVLLALAIWILVGSVAALVLGRAIRFGNPMDEGERKEPYPGEMFKRVMEGPKPQAKVHRIVRTPRKADWRA